MLTASRRIDKCFTPGQRFSDKFPTAGTDKMTNTRQMPQLQQSYKFINEMASTRRWHLNPFTLENYPLWDYFAANNFQINELKKNGISTTSWSCITLQAEATFALSELACETFRQLTQRKCSLCSSSKGRVAFAITRFITFQRLRFYNLLAYRD